MQISIDEETVKKLAALKIKDLANDFDFLSDEVFAGETAEEVKLSTEEYCRRISDGV